jgi:NitT/TauT family transport system permease protein
MKMRLDPYLPVVGVIGLIIVWYLAVWYEVVDKVLLPSPADTFRALWKVIDFFRSTPASAMFPLFLVLFGVGDETRFRSPHSARHSSSSSTSPMAS